MNPTEFKNQYEKWRLEVESSIEKYLPTKETRPSIIHEAMLYSMQAGGKRIRPILLLAAADMLGQSQDPFAACVAIESLHTYSLIHDDLPCMDDSDMRRGRPTCHKKFGETMALLAGDALLTHAFFLLSDSYKANAKIANGLVLDLSDAASSQKLIGGQVEDILNERSGTMTAENLKFIHDNKTAALITSAVTMGVRLSDKCTEETLKYASEMGLKIGLAFQVIDDILDATADSETLGKTAGLDAKHGKMTYITLYGLEGARKIAEDLSKDAIALCDKIGPNNAFMKALINYMLNRIN